MGLSGVALALAAIGYRGSRWSWPIWVLLGFAVLGALSIFLAPEWMLYPDGGPGEFGVVLWQMPLYLSAALASWLLLESYRKARSQEPFRLRAL